MNVSFNGSCQSWQLLFYIVLRYGGDGCKIGDNQITPQPPLLHTHVPFYIGGVC